MTYAQRRQRAIEDVRGLLADARDDREMVLDEQHARAAEDRAETGGRDAFDFMDDRPSPGHQRALDSVRESQFCQERFHGDDAAQLRAAFGPDKDDDDLTDDEDDYLE